MLINYALMDALVIVVPPLIAIALCFLMLNRSYKKALELGFPKPDPNEKNMMKNVLLIFVGVPFAYSLLELVVLLKMLGCFNGTYSLDNLTAVMDLGSQVAGFGGFVLTISVGLIVVKQIHRNNQQLSARLSNPNPGEILAGRDPAAFKKMMMKLVVVEVLSILLLAAVIWLMKLDTSTWDDVLVHKMVLL